MSEFHITVRLSVCLDNTTTSPATSDNVVIIKLRGISYIRFNAIVKKYKTTSTEEEHEDQRFMQYFLNAHLLLDGELGASFSKTTITGCKLDLDKRFYSLESQLFLPFSRKGKLCLIIINTYFQGFASLTHPQPDISDNWPFNGSPQ